MQGVQVERCKMVTLPQEEFEAILERAAESGARHALSEVWLDGPEAARDISELRGLLDAFNEAKKTAGLSIGEDADHGPGVGAARGGVCEVEGVRGWAVREAGQSIPAGRAPLSEGNVLSKQTGLPGPCFTALSIVSVESLRRSSRISSRSA